MESALVAAIDVVLVSAVDATQKVTSFSSDLKRLKSILCSVKLAIADIERFNNVLDRPQNETEMFALRLLEGETLVRKCSDVSRWNVFKRWYYSKKLHKFQDLLLNFFQIDVAAHQFREIKRISVMMTHLEEKVDKLMKKTDTLGEFSSEIVVGIELPCQEEEEEETRLLEGGGNMWYRINSYTHWLQLRA